MTNTPTTTTNEAANNTEQGATVAPEKALSNKGASHQKGVPKGNKGIKGKAQHTTPFDQSEATGNARGAKVARAKAPKKTTRASFEAPQFVGLLPAIVSMRVAGSTAPRQGLSPWRFRPAVAESTVAARLAKR
jgi:hypothetical protein